MTTATSPSRLELEDIASLAKPLADAVDLDPLLERIGDARYVLLGEASHGTAEFYRWRAAITQRLIADHGFSFVAVEGDWPDCFDLNCWVKGHHGEDLTATNVLARFDRWPTWMWANREVVEFAEWLHRHNRRTGAGIGFYGLDVYSLWESMHRVVEYLRANQPDDVQGALEAWRCFEPYAEDPQRYAWATRMVPASCEPEVLGLLCDLRSRFGDRPGTESDFDALQNAEVLAGAERYYRAMVRADGESWNIRDCHMADTLDRLLAHHGVAAKAVVWEHNTHVGDARATDMSAAGMINVGQVVRERHHADGVVLVGFGSYEGSVIAATQWGAPMQRMRVPPAPASSHEGLIHVVTSDPALFMFPDEWADSAWLTAKRGHRAIGVVYHPDRDLYGNWVPTILGQRYDAFIAFGRAEALHPLHAETPQPHAEQETYPFTT